MDESHLTDDLHIGRLLRQKKGSPWRTMGRWATGIFCFGAVIAVILGFGEIQQFLAVMAAVRPGWIVLAAVVQLGTYVCAAAVWYEVMKYSGHPLTLKSLFPLTVAQLFTRQVVPTGGLSGALVVVKGFLNRGIPEPVGLGCMMVGMASYYMAYLLAVMASLVLIEMHRGISTILFVTCALFSFVAIGIPAVVLGLYYMGTHDRVPAFVKRLPLAREMLKILPKIPVNLMKNPILLFKTTLLQLCIFLIDSATLFIMLKAVGSPRPFGVAFSSHVMASVAATIGPIPLGLGTYEGAGVALLHVAGTPLEPALAAILLLRGFTFWLPMLPGFWLARRELGHHRRRRSAAG